MGTPRCKAASGVETGSSIDPCASKNHGLIYWQVRGILKVSWHASGMAFSDHIYWHCYRNSQESDVSGAPTLILACEEPELYQHPPQARHLASDATIKGLAAKIRRLSSLPIIRCLCRERGSKDVRMVRKECWRRIFLHLAYVVHGNRRSLSEEPPRAKNPQSLRGRWRKFIRHCKLGLNEMFFARRLVLVEGLEDMAYLLAYINLLRKVR